MSTSYTAIFDNKRLPRAHYILHSGTDAAPTWNGTQLTLVYARIISDFLQNGSNMTALKRKDLHDQECEYRKYPRSNDLSTMPHHAGSATAAQTELS